MEGRLAALEKKYGALQKHLEKAHGRVTTEVTQLDAAIGDEQQEREQRDREIEERLETFSTGGLSIEWTGLVWLFVGIVCATIPDEIARHFWAACALAAVALLAWLLFLFTGARRTLREEASASDDAA